MRNVHDNLKVLEAGHDQDVVQMCCYHYGGGTGNVTAVR